MRIHIINWRRHQLLMEIEQFTKADRNACHAICNKGKSRATLRRLSSTVLHPVKLTQNKSVVAILIIAQNIVNIS